MNSDKESPWLIDEGIISTAATLAGRNNEKLTKETKEPIQEFIEELNFIITTGIGHTSDEAPGIYTIKYPAKQTAGHTRSIHDLLYFAKKAEKNKNLVIETGVTEYAYPDLPCFRDDSAGLQYITEALKNGNRSHVIDRLAQNDLDNKYNKNYAGPVACVFDTKNNQLIILNESACESMEPAPEPAF